MPALLLLLAACAGDPAEKSPVVVEDTGTPAAPTADAGPDLEIPVGQALTLEGAGENAASFTWDLGDGTVIEGAAATHTYDRPGVYTAVLQVTGPLGDKATDRARVVAYLPLAGRPPRWSSTIALSEDGARIFVVNPEAGTIGVIDVATQALEEWPACAGPRTLSIDGPWLYAACEDEDALAWWDLDEGRSGLVPFPAGSRPFGVAAREGSAWVSLAGTGQLAEVVDGAYTLHEVGPDPRGVAIAADGRILASRFRSPDTGGVVYVLGEPDLHLPLDLAGDSDTTTGGVPNLLEQLVPSPDGGTLYLPFLHANLLRGSWVSGAALTHDSTLRAVMGSLDLETGVEDPLQRKQIDERGRAGALAPSPLGERLYLLHPDSRTVTVLDTWTGDLAGSIQDVGHAPTGLVVSPDGHTLYVHAWLDRRVLAFDVQDLSSPPTPAWAAPTLHEEPLSAEILLGKQVFWDAADKRITRAGYISCANCHPDGDHDGRTWDFTDRGEGLRNTPTLLGRAGLAMGPVHWSANFDEIQDFENDMRNAFGGTGFLSESDWEDCEDTLGPEKAGRSPELDALAAYVSSLDRAPASPHLPPEGGEQAFLEAGCAECHPAPLYTDSSLESFLRHDVGTLSASSGQRLGMGPLDGLDTPTLLGTWATAPYLHDGSAETLEAAIAAHDQAAGLDGEVLERIAGFVRSL